MKEARTALNFAKVEIVAIFSVQPVRIIINSLRPAGDYFDNRTHLSILSQLYNNTEPVNILPKSKSLWSVQFQDSIRESK